MTGRAWTRARATLTGWRRTLAVLVALAVLVVMMAVSAVTARAATWSYITVRPNGNCHILQWAGYDRQGIFVAGPAATDGIGLAFICYSAVPYCRATRTWVYPKVATTTTGYYKLSEDGRWLEHYFPLLAPKVPPSDGPYCPGTS